VAHLSKRHSTDSDRVCYNSTLNGKDTMTPKIELGRRKITCLSHPPLPDRTRVDNCREGAIDVLKEYFAKIGGRPEPKGQKRKGRPSVSGAKSESEAPTTSSKRAKPEKTPKVEKAWSPPPGSWEHEVSYVDTVEEMRDPKTGELGKFVYLVWNNQQKTQHPLKHVYQKCPQKVCLSAATRSDLH
jgi:hypothetical protein